MCGLLVGQRTDGGIAEFLVVVAEGVETEVIEHLRRDNHQGVCEIVGTVQRVHGMSGKNDGQVVFVVVEDLSVVHGPCIAAQYERQDGVRKNIVFLEVEEAMHLTHNEYVGLLNRL